MGSFLQQEKIRQVFLKKTSPLFSDQAREDGLYKKKLHPFCVPLTHARENLFPGIRESAPQFFADHGIGWHIGENGNPSNHLCSSQVCCVNFLFPLSKNPEAIAEIFRPIYPQLKNMLPVEDGHYISFEWIGEENYLGEKTGKSAQRTRGANFTSADAIIMFEREDGLRQIVLIEWKYTESYSSTSYKTSKSGTDRTAIYRHLFEQADCPINKDLLPGFDTLFYEPFYQLMRQQFLAHEMEKAHELGADVVSVLHLAPAHNLNFRKVTSPDLRGMGDSATAVWKKLVVGPEKFNSISTEDLFGNLSVERMPELQDWILYLFERYSWLRD